MGIPCIGLNDGPTFKHSEAFSFQVSKKDQAETDRYWNAIVGNGSQESQCGWCKEKWGLSWQITPAALTESMSDKDPAVRKWVFTAMTEMKTINIVVIYAARKGREAEMGSNRIFFNYTQYSFSARRIFGLSNS